MNKNPWENIERILGERFSIREERENADGEGTKALKRTKDGRYLEQPVLQRKVPEHVKKIVEMFQVTSDIDQAASYAGVPHIVAHRVLRNYGYDTQYKKKI